MGTKSIKEIEFKCDKVMCTKTERFYSRTFAGESMWRTVQHILPDETKCDQFTLCPKHARQVWEFLNDDKKL